MGIEIEGDCCQVKLGPNYIDPIMSVVVCSITFCLLITVPSFGQTNYSSSADSLPRQGSAPTDYAIGPGDVLSITIADLPEISGKYVVSETGMLALPVVPTPIRAAGLSAEDLSRDIGEALTAAQQLREPVVNVFVEEYRSQTVTVLGAVARPSVYPLRKNSTLLEVLSTAGGLLPQAGNTLTLQHKPLSAGDQDAEDIQQTNLDIDLRKLMQGKDSSLNLAVEGGDVVTVSAAPLVYVIGAVTKPGGYVLQDTSAGLTILQALAMAEGLKSTAAPKRGVIIRQSPGSSDRQEIPVDINKLLEGKDRGTLLASSDVLFIPESGMKKSMQKMGEFAMQVANGVAIYGVGYRVGGVIP